MRRAAAVLLFTLSAGCAYDFEDYLPLEGDGGLGQGPDVATGTDAPGTPGADAPASDAPVACTEPGGQVLDNHCYFPSGRTHWNGARDACASAGAHLVTITSEAEHALVEKIRAGRDRWIGLRRGNDAPSAAASFTWITGETSAFAKWGTGEPQGRGQCARLRDTNVWADQDCKNSYEAICERE